MGKDELLFGRDNLNLFQRFPKIIKFILKVAMYNRVLNFKIKLENTLHSGSAKQHIHIR